MIYKHIKKVILLTLISVPELLFAQHLIKGKVIAGKDLVAGANIFIKDTYDGTTSNQNGEFSFQTSEKGNVIIVVSFVGFEKSETPLFITNAEHVLTIKLVEKPNELNTVTITAGSFEAGADIKKVMILSSIDIATTAGADADIYSAIQTLPGTQAASQEEGLFVRGGAASETKTLFDGLWVQKPFLNDVPNVAQRGRFSPFEFKGTTFSSGGYSAQYGQALSSVLILESKDLADKTTSDIGVMTAGLTAGHTQRLKNSSFNVNASYFNLTPAFKVIKQNIDWVNEPQSIAIGGNYRVKTSQTGLLKIFTTNTTNSLKLNKQNLDPINTKTLVDNKDKATYTNITYSEYLNDDWKINAGLGVNVEGNNFKLDSNLLIRYDNLNQARLSLNGYINKKLQAKVGVDYILQIKDEKWNSISSYLEEQLTSTYLEFDYYFNYKWVLRAGARIEHSKYFNASKVVPRISMAYKHNKQHQYSIAYGQFVQSPSDVYLIRTNQLNFEQATHYLANYQFQTEKYIFRIEGYRKNYNQLVTTNSTETVFENNGSGYAQGFDIFWRDRKSIKRGDYWISYSYLDTKRKYKDYPVLATPTFAAKHTLNIVYKEYVPKIQTQISATYTFATGRTYYNPNNTEFLKDKTNNYHNFSISASYLTSIKNHFTVVFLSAGNIFGINNIYGYEYSNDGTRRMALEPNAARTLFVGMFISIGDDNVLN